MVLYHITKRRHLSKIFTEGLIPGKRRGMYIPKQKLKQVFLTNDIEKIIKWQCGTKWTKKNDCVVLHIDTDGLDVEPHKYSSGGTYTLSDFEFVVDKVPANKIVKVSEICN